MNNTRCFKRANSVLVYRLGSLGDTIVALPSFHAIKRFFPTQKITLLTNKPVSSKAPPAAAVLGDGHFVDDVIGYPLRTRNPFTLLKLVIQMRERGVDTVVNLAAFRSFVRTKRDAAFFRLAGARRLVGFDLSDRDKQGWLDPETGLTEWEASRIARRVQEFERIDLNAAANWDLRLTELEESAARHLLWKVADKTRLLGVSVGTKVPAKDWGLDNWRTLLAKLSAELPDWTVVFYGSAEEGRISSQCALQWRGASINACGKASPRESAAAMRQCRVFVGHDSGPMHLAACVGTPCVAIFSARNLPRQWFPRGEDHSVIYHHTDCAGCGLEKCLVQNNKCLRAITVDQVMAAVRKALN